jgi:acyl-CoA reductase-like NAD-dependent aldehyde dehydrogenase
VETVARNATRTMNSAPAQRDSIHSINPATDEIFASFDPTPIELLTQILAQARTAQTAWSAIAIRKRCAAIRHLRDNMFARREELATLVSRETGKPLAEAIFADVLTCLDTAHYLADNASEILAPRRVPHHSIAAKFKRGWLEYEPYGIIGIIAPWNYPLAIPLAETIAAVIAGNAVILKPSELTPSCGKIIGELFAESNFPSNLVQIIFGAGDLGAALIEVRPDKLVFTGSVAAGRKVAEACAARLIPSVLELGGKDPMIVFRDADLENASSGAVWGSYMNCGQTCISVERIYAERPIAEEFTRLCVEKTKRLKVAASTDPDAEIGPLIRARDVDRVESQIREAVAAGAQVLTGGNRRPDLGPNFFEPTIIIDVNPSMRIMREETFGPVLAIQIVDSADEAITLANDSTFALSASVWTQDTRRGAAIASKLRAGSVMINDVASYFAIAEAPHGGRGESGWGRTHSRFGLLELVQVKYIDADGMKRTPKPWWFGYDSALATAADRFLQFCFAPSWTKRISSARGAARTMFRGHRI